MTSTTTKMIYAPLAQVPGLAFRHWQDRSDFQIALDLYNAERTLNGIDRSFTVKDFEEGVKWYENFDIKEQYIFAQLNGKAIGFFNYNWEQDGTGQYLLFLDGTLLPEYYQEEIAGCMLSYAEEKLREMTSMLPRDHSRHFRMGRRLINKAACDFFQEKGFHIERYFYNMRRPIGLPTGDHPLPEGIEVRPVTPDHYRAIWDAEHEAFRDHWGYIPPLEQHFDEWLKNWCFQPQYWKVAWDTNTNQVAGMVRNFHKPEEDVEFSRKRGYTENISVRRPWRGKGLAKALIAESIRMFREMGMEETYLGVDADNPNGALKLYQAMGYQELPEETTAVFQKPCV